MKEPQLICVIGAESTGKTSLARALAHELRAPWVAEYLREFCDAHARTPRREEQQHILDTQVKRENDALQTARLALQPFVLCDTAPLLTAIYSEYVFGDLSLYTQAYALHARYVHTLLLETDLPWLPDGIQRDGEHVRKPIHALIEKHLREIRAPYTTISGDGHARTLNASRAIDSLLERVNPY
ncbi:MAG: AAA family ATPase [Casimicrobium sp.]